jgi:hypothetical protein
MLEHWRERASRITVFYRRLTSINVVFRLIFPPNSLPLN